MYHFVKINMCIILLKLICIKFFSSAFIFQVLVLFFKLIFIGVSILAWKISWTEQPGDQQSLRLQRFRYDLVTEHASVVALSIKWITNQNLSTSLNLSQFICITPFGRISLYFCFIASSFIFVCSFKAQFLHFIFPIFRHHWGI